MRAYHLTSITPGPILRRATMTHGKAIPRTSIRSFQMYWKQWDRQELSLTLFIVGRDAALSANCDAMRRIGASRHEVGNHSHEHEPWITGRTVAQIAGEIELAQDSITAATGRRPTGFRSPGYALAPNVLEALGSLGFAYDASSLPTCIGPLARAYYFATAKLTAVERDQRRASIWLSS